MLAVLLSLFFQIENQSNAYAEIAEAEERGPAAISGANSANAAGKNANSTNTTSKSATSTIASGTNTGSANAKNLRNYPGGRDEEDLKVQESIVNPAAKLDRRTIEGKVLKINLKKVGSDSDESESTEQ